MTLGSKAKGLVHHSYKHSGNQQLTYFQENRKWYSFNELTGNYATVPGMRLAGHKRDQENASPQRSILSTLFLTHFFLFLCKIQVPQILVNHELPL